MSKPIAKRANMKDVVIVAAGRTPVGSFNGSLAKLPAHQLGATVIKGLLAKIDLNPEQVNEVILGQVLTAGTGPVPSTAGGVARWTTDRGTGFDD